MFLAACVVGAAGTISVLAFGNPDYLGILDGAPTTGFQASPNAYDISSGPATVTLDQSVTNLTSQTQTVALSMRVHHILTLNGADISDGQPGQSGITFTPGLYKQTTQTLIGATSTVQFAIPPAGAPPTLMTWSWTFTTCGYFQLDIAGASHRTLGGGFVRVLGCSPPTCPNQSIPSNFNETTIPGGEIIDGPTLSFFLRAWLRGHLLRRSRGAAFWL
jgi:hypothetical protein